VRNQYAGEFLEDLDVSTQLYGDEKGTEYGLQVVKCLYCRYPGYRIYRKEKGSPDIHFTICFRCFQNYFRPWDNISDVLGIYWREKPGRFTGFSNFISCIYLLIKRFFLSMA